MTPCTWCQVTIGFPDWARAEHTAVTHLAPLLTTAETNGLVTAWFFVRKRPCWRVRYLPAADTPDVQEYLHARIGDLQKAQHITQATSVVYEPETHAFGGPEAMAAAHRLWHLDSRHLLAYLAATVGEPATRRRRELSILLCSTMLRAACLDWYEQGDVWARVADHRDPPDHVSKDDLPTLQARVRRLMSVETDGLTRADAFIAEATGWAAAFAAAGRELAHLNSAGLLHRGLRDVLAHHIIFASNRLGLPATTQAVLATTAKTIVFGCAPQRRVPPTGHDEPRPESADTTISDTGKAAVIDPTGPIARRFPLVARPRPACTPLPQRVADLRNRAISAAREQDTAQATAVFNLAALLASDCGLPSLARQWSHRLAREALRHYPRNAPQAIHSLEPIVNLARLRTRAGDGLGAWSLLEDLYQAIATRTDTVIDDIEIPAAGLTSAPDIHRELRAWLWAVLLSSGARALAVAGRWNDAHRRLTQYKGIGHRMLDGRQIAVIAHATTNNPDAAQALLHDTPPGQPWENAVTACLTRLCLRYMAPSADESDPLDAYRRLVTTAPGLTVFHTRLGLSLIDAHGGVGQTAVQAVVPALLDHAATDGYAARDVLAHPDCRSAATDQQLHSLAHRVDACGLDIGSVPDALLAEISDALDTAEGVISTKSPASS